MVQMFYDTMSEALNGLYKRGFTYDFNLITRKTYDLTDHLPMQDFEIEQIIRFENDSDPGENAILYTIVSDKHHIKGTLVNGFGIYADSFASRFVNSLKLQKHEA